MRFCWFLYNREFTAVIHILYISRLRTVICSMELHFDCWTKFYLQVIPKSGAKFNSLPWHISLWAFMLLFLTWPLALPLVFWKTSVFSGICFVFYNTELPKWDSPETILPVMITKMFQLDTLIFCRAFQLLQRFSFISHLICIID